MTEEPSPSARPVRPKASPEDVALSRKIFFGMMGTLAFLLISLVWGAVR
ncbi:MAG: hypothetical protein HY055_03625 [Magnetospirillum sp.]|nr:hypothetical protein [Magnetospirillum sp.]